MILPWINASLPMFQVPPSHLVKYPVVNITDSHEETLHTNTLGLLHTVRRWGRSSFYYNSLNISISDMISSTKTTSTWKSSVLLPSMMHTTKWWRSRWESPEGVKLWSSQAGTITNIHISLKIVKIIQVVFLFLFLCVKYIIFLCFLWLSGTLLIIPKWGQ